MHPCGGAYLPCCSRLHMGSTQVPRQRRLPPKLHYVVPFMRQHGSNLTSYNSCTFLCVVATVPITLPRLRLTQTTYSRAALALFAPLIELVRAEGAALGFP